MIKAQRSAIRLSPAVKKKMTDALVRCYREAPALLVGIAPDLYAELVAELGSGPQQRMFEGYVTEREEAERTRRLQHLLGQTTWSREEGIEAIEHFIA